MNALRQPPRNLLRRYLIQMRYESANIDGAEDGFEIPMNRISDPIEMLGGRIEHQWRTSQEFDLIMVIRIPPHQVSIESIEMALQGTPSVREARTTPLYTLDQSLDQPEDQLSPSWLDTLERDLVERERKKITDSASRRATGIDSLDPIDWETI